MYKFLWALTFVAAVQVSVFVGSRLAQQQDTEQRLLHLQIQKLEQEAAREQQLKQTLVELNRASLAVRQERQQQAAANLEQINRMNCSLTFYNGERVRKEGC